MNSKLIFSDNKNLNKLISLFEKSPVCHKIVDLDDNLQYMSSAGINQLNISNIKPYYGSVYPFDFYSESARTIISEHLHRAKAGEISSLESMVVALNGHEIWYNTTFIPSYNDEGQIDYIIVTSVDNTENIVARKRMETQLREHEHQLQTFLNGSTVLMWWMNAKGRPLLFNDAWLEFVGRNFEQELQVDWKGQNIHPEHRSECLEIYDRCLVNQTSFRHEYRMCNKDGEYRWLLESGTPQFDQTKQYQGYIGTAVDITERKQMEVELQFLATHDPLTGLYNRNVMEQRLNDEIQRASRYNHALSVFMLDIDHFKAINDTCGHGTGDTVLQEIAKLIEHSIRNTDYAARYGGEEFVVILPETTRPKATELAERLRKQIAGYSLTAENDKTLNLTVSIGIGIFPEYAQSSEDLLAVADSAMYAAKKAGRNTVKTP